LVLRDLLDRPETDEEVRELKRLQEDDPMVLKFLELQNEDGSFRGGEGGGGILGVIRLTAQALMGLGYFGLGPDNPAVRRGADYLFAQQQPNGAFPLITQGAVLDGPCLCWAWHGRGTPPIHALNGHTTGCWKKNSRKGAGPRVDTVTNTYLREGIEGWHIPSLVAARTPLPRSAPWHSILPGEPAGLRGAAWICC
jgi:hypothetical protein